MLQLLGLGRGLDQLEFEPRGLADQRLQRFGILDAGHLDEDPAGALVDDRHLVRAVRVDAAADDVARDGPSPRRCASVEPGLRSGA